MIELLPSMSPLAWPLVVALAWVAGEVVHARIAVPRISVYGAIGFACAPAQFGVLPPASVDGGAALLANVAFGLILCEFGYRINLRWLRTNPWLTATALLEASATFAVVFVIARAAGSPMLTSLLLASLAMSTSPAALVRVINEQRSSGQVTERVLHIAAVDCVLAVFCFKVVVGFWTFASSANLLQAVSNSIVVLAASAGLGAVFGAAVPGLLRRTGRLGQDATVAFAIAVVLVVGIALAFKISPLLAALTFGLVARQRRVALNQAQRNFGALGDLLAVILFTYAASTLEWSRVLAGLPVALMLVGGRAAAKVLAPALLARPSGVTLRKGVLTGVALMPISVFVILLLEQTRYLGIDLLDQLAPLAAATLLLELVGPVLTLQALQRAGEAHPPRRED